MVLESRSTGGRGCRGASTRINTGRIRRRVCFILYAAEFRDVKCSAINGAVIGSVNSLWNELEVAYAVVAWSERYKLTARGRNREIRDLRVIISMVCLGLGV